MQQMIESQDPFEELLEQTVGALDVPVEQQQRAVALYEDLGSWLKERDRAAGRREPDVFPQGSFALGTPIMPVKRADDFDIDLVYARPIAKQSTTQQQLLAEAREHLVEYIADLKRRELECPKLQPKDRCWALKFARYHLDLLPAIPVSLDMPEGRLLISDRELRDWLPTDPRAFARWFFDQMEVLLLESRMALAEATGRDVEQVPEWEAKTPLQRAVQLAKQHRDLFFSADPKRKPPSIAVTTLAGQAYRGERTITEAVARLAALASAGGVPGVFERRADGWWVPNPVMPKENLLRNWSDDSRCEVRFFQWARKLKKDLADLREARGAPQIRAVITEAFGVEAATAAVDHLGRSLQRPLRMAASTGTLGAIGAVEVPPHTFHGP